MRKIKILFCIESLHGGGAEKVLAETVRKLDPNKYDITVLSLFDGGPYVEVVEQACDYRYAIPMPKSVIVKKIIKKILLRVVFRLMSSKLLYKLCVRGRYDVEVAFLEGMATRVISGSSNSRSRKYAWVHVDLAAHPYSTRYYLNFRHEKKAYSVFDRILCVSSQVQWAFIGRYKIDPSRVAVQLNVLDEVEVINKSLQSAPFALSPMTLIAVGRLVPQKGFQMLLSVLARLKKDDFKFSLVIIGEGSDRRMLEDDIKRLGLGDTVTLAGFIANPYPLIAQADLFVSSSVAEGFSTVVSEAVILGIPVVTTETAGMKDILGDSEYGLIVPNTEDGLYEGLKYILQDNGRLDELKRGVMKRKQFFTVAARTRELDDLFSSEYIKEEV